LTGPGGAQTTPKERALNTAPARVYERDWRGVVARGLGADPLRPGIPAAQPFAAVFARDRSRRGGANYTEGTGPEHGAREHI